MRLMLTLLLVAVASPAAFAQTSFPMITHSTPTAVQRGTTVEVTVACRTSSLFGAYKVLVEGEGVTAEIVPVKPAKAAKSVDPKLPPPVVPTVKLKVIVAANAALGVREFRIATALGISSLGQLVVVDVPVVTERPGINLPAKAQPIPVPSAICGRTEVAENVDYYSFHAKAGQLLTFEVYCARIQDKIHDLQKHADPLITVFDLQGRELAANDDGYFADPMLSFEVPKDGEYRLAVRDAKYDGDARWSYVVTVTDRPYVQHVFPLGFSRGKTTSIEPVMSNPALKPKWTFTPGSQLGPQTHVFPGAPNPTPIVVSDLPTSREIEPNDTLKQATRLSIPCGVNGRIGVKRDLDYFTFTAKKGQALRLEVFARRFGSPLQSEVDTMLDVMNPAGKVLASNDDLNGKDAGFTFTPPADGDYVVRVRDLNNKGGDGFVYFLEIDFARPDFTIKCDPSKAMIGPGSRTAWYVLVTRVNGFTGPVKVEVQGLPAGVSVNPLTIPANMKQGCLVLAAAPNAKIAANAVQVIGSADATDTAGKPVRLTRVATPVEEIYMPGGGRGRFDVKMQAVAVTNPSDLLEVRVKQNRITLKPGQEVKIDVTVIRRADFNKGMTLDVRLRHLGSIFGDPLPPGVTLVEGKSKTLLGTGSSGHIVLKAAANAPECTDVPICVQGFVPINFVVKIGYASEPIWITVKK